MSEEQNKENTELTVFEELRRDLAVKSDLKVPVSYVFGRGTVGNIASFGGRSLQENSVKVDYAIANTNELQNIWNHSHSQWIWKHLNLSYHAPLNNMRQISAEMAAKKGALNEAKWRHVETELKIKKIEDELSRPDDLDYWREVELKVKLAKYKESLAEGMTYIEGAMKDVLALNELYEQLKEKVSGFSEADVEREETKSHLKRSLVQSIRDVRMSGVITKAEQEYLEHIGVNPMKIQGLLQKYVETEAKSERWDIGDLYDFVDNLTDELVDVYKVDQKRMNLQGFKQEYVDDFSYTNKLALLQSNKKEE